MEKTYLFNPFNIKQWENERIKQEVDEMITKYRSDENSSLSMFEYAKNVEVTANILYLLGEMIARLSEEVLILKNEVSSTYGKQVYLSRKQWIEENSEKPPAMSYFEAKTSDFVKDERIKLAKKESDLKRFKLAYDSMESQMNANKKKMDAVKFEEFGK